MGKISTQELAGVLVERWHIGKKEASQFVNELFFLIQKSLNEDKIVKVKGLGTFKIIDVDDRESVNVNTGDRVLIETGRLLTEAFGEDHCYRYGGDEFLVIIPDISETEFRETLDSVKQKGGAVTGDPKAGFSAGYVHALLKDPDMLRNLISRADERMYEEKQQRKKD